MSKIVNTTIEDDEIVERTNDGEFRTLSKEAISKIERASTLWDKMTIEQRKASEKRLKAPYNPSTLAWQIELENYYAELDKMV